MMKYSAPITIYDLICERICWFCFIKNRRVLCWRCYLVNFWGWFRCPPTLLFCWKYDSYIIQVNLNYILKRKGKLWYISKQKFSEINLCIWWWFWNEIWYFKRNLIISKQKEKRKFKIKMLSKINQTMKLERNVQIDQNLSTQVLLGG